MINGEDEDLLNVQQTKISRYLRVKLLLSYYKEISKLLLSYYKEMCFCNYLMKNYFGLMCNYFK